MHTSYEHNIYIPQRNITLISRAGLGSAPGNKERGYVSSTLPPLTLRWPVVFSRNTLGCLDSSVASRTGTSPSGPSISTLSFGSLHGGKSQEYGISICKYRSTLSALRWLPYHCKKRCSWWIWAGYLIIYQAQKPNICCLLLQKFNLVHGTW